jgi:DNA repair exonuclease SbcCD ATPase subunit
VTATDLTALALRVRSVRQRLDVEVGAARTVAQHGQRLTAQISELVANQETAERVSGVLSRIGSDRDAAAREQVEGLVTAGLRAVFEEDLSFHLIEVSTRQTPQIDFVVRTHVHGSAESFDTDVLSARGGGLAAVVGLLLRVVVVLLLRQVRFEESPPILCLDETLAMLSRDHLNAAGDFLRTLVDRTGLQVLMVSHQEELAEAADAVYALRLDAQGVTQTRRIR